MSCSKCGLPTFPDQKFCRSCGADLRMTTQPLPQRTSLPDGFSSPRVRPEDAPHRTNNLMLVGFIILFLGVAVGVVGKKLIHDDVVSVVGILISLIGMFLTVYPHLTPSKRRRSDSTTLSEPQLSPSEPVKSLPQERSIEYVPSITERTTGLLEQAGTKSKRRDGGETES